MVIPFKLQKSANRYCGDDPGPSEAKDTRSTLYSSTACVCVIYEKHPAPDDVLRHLKALIASHPMVDLT